MRVLVHFQLQKSDILSGLLQEAGNRYLLFNNEADANEKEKQRMQLLRLVKEVVIQNGGCCFQQTISRQLSDTGTSTGLFCCECKSLFLSYPPQVRHDYQPWELSTPLDVYTVIFAFKFTDDPV